MGSQAISSSHHPSQAQQGPRGQVDRQVARGQPGHRDRARRQSSPGQPGHRDRAAQEAEGAGEAEVRPVVAVVAEAEAGEVAEAGKAQVFAS